MKKNQILITIALILSIISPNVFAAEQSAGLEQNTVIIKKHEQDGKGEKDPLKRLEKRKELIEKELKEGKITKEKADEMTDRIDKHIAKIKEFNSLSLPQKKQFLSEKFKSRIDHEVKQGKITKEEGDKALDEFNNSLENWDGKGFPQFMKKNDKCNKCPKKQTE